MVKNLAISIDFCMFFFVHFGCSQLAEKWFIFGFWNLNEVYFYIYLFDGKKTIETTFSFSVFFFFSSFVHSLIQSRRSKMWLRLFFFIQFFLWIIDIERNTAWMMNQLFFWLSLDMAHQIQIIQWAEYLKL